MLSRVFTDIWRRPFFVKRSRRCVTIYLPFSKISTRTDSILELIPREELVTKFKSRLRGRQFLPGSTDGGFPEFLAEPRDSFPLGVRVISSTQSSLAELTTKCMEYVEENLPNSPAILFRDLPAKTAEDFSVIARAIQGKPMKYKGGTAFRTAVDKTAGTYTASNEPDCFTIEMHNDMSYNDVFPSRLFFFCLNEPPDGCGGETPLVKNSELFSKLDPAVLQRFEEKQIRYVRYLPDKTRGEYLNWQHVFVTENREDVAARATQQGYSIRWDISGDLYLWQNRSAFMTHPSTGDKVWFNQVISQHNTYPKALPRFIGADIPDDRLPCHTYYGDGDEIEPEVLQHIRATSWTCAVGFKWRSGDLLVMDNLRVQHGRIGFTGDRKILVYMTI